MSDTVRVVDQYVDEYTFLVEDCSDTSVVGCDGSFCGEDADMQTAYPLDDLPTIAFCRVCWTREMSRRKRTGKGTILPFPGNDSENHPPLRLRYPGFDSADHTFEKIRHSGRLED